MAVCPGLRRNGVNPFGDYPALFVLVPSAEPLLTQTTMGRAIGQYRRSSSGGSEPCVCARPRYPASPLSHHHEREETAVAVAAETERLPAYGRVQADVGGGSERASEVGVHRSSQPG